jgi:hypothetical protein
MSDFHLFWRVAEGAFQCERAIDPVTVKTFPRLRSVGHAVSFLNDRP